MAFPIYTCPAELARNVPELLARHDIVAERIECGAGHDRYAIRRGLARVQFGGGVEQSGECYTFFLTGSSNPLRWPFDMRLCRKVESLLLSAGAKYSDARQDNAA
jgi:hypothetical protein